MIEANTTAGKNVMVSSEQRKPARRAAAPAARTAEKRNAPISGLAIVLIVVALLVGGGLGALLMRQRHNADRTVFVVNGQTIDKETFYKRLEQKVGPETARGLINETLVRQFARSKGVEPKAEEVEKAFARAKATPDYEQTRNRNGYTDEDVRYRILLDMSRNAALTKGVSITDADIKTFYEVNADKKNPYARYYQPEAAQIAVIINPDEKKIRQAFSDLNNRIPFATVAKTYSKDRSADSSGILSPILKGRTRSRTVPGLDDAVFGLKIGERMPPRRFAGTWWIIQCLDKKPEETVPFEKVKEECREGAVLVKAGPDAAKKVSQEFQDYQKKANVQVFWPRYQSVVQKQ